MKKVLMMFLLAGSIHAAENPICTDKYGVMRCSSGTIDSINYRGIVDLDRTTVNGIYKVLGNSDIQNSHLNDVYVRGSVHINRTDIRKEMEIIGNTHANNVEILGSTKVVGDFFGTDTVMSSLANLIGTIKCDHCKFKNDAALFGDVDISNTEVMGLTILNAKTSSFSASKLNNITVKKPSRDEEQIVQLKDSTIVHNIYFENHKGFVVLSGKSKITGTVDGGKIETKSNY